MNALLLPMATMCLLLLATFSGPVRAQFPTDDDSNILDNTIPETDAATSGAGGKPAAFDWVKITESPPPKVLHPLGTSVELECEATGSPPPTISWVRGKNAATRALNAYAANAVATRSGSAQTLVRVRSRLIIDRSDVAVLEYSCVALAGGKSAIASTIVYGPMHGGGLAGLLKSSVRHPQDTVSDSGEEAAIGLTLHAHPAADGLRKPRIVSYYNVIFEPIGTDVFLPCSAVGTPTPDVYWLNGEDQVIGHGAKSSSSAAASAAANGSRMHVTKGGELLISDLKWSDMGTYRCVANNPLGKDTVATFVYPVLPV